MRLLKPGKGLIGVDITSATVKLLELKQYSDSYQVDSYAVQPLRVSAASATLMKWRVCFGVLSSMQSPLLVKRQWPSQRALPLLKRLLFLLR